MTMIKENIEIETIQKSTYKTVEIHRLNLDKKKCWGFFCGGDKCFCFRFFWGGGGFGGVRGVVIIFIRFSIKTLCTEKRSKAYNIPNQKCKNCKFCN